MKERKKTSIVWKIDRNEFIKVVNKSNSIRAMLKHFGLHLRGGNYKTIKARIQREGIDISRLAKGLNSNKGRKLPREAVPIENVLTEQSAYNRFHLKKRVIKEGLIENKCKECGQGPVWNGKPLTLQLDHLNGISDDNRLDNLRLLCPNCHTQTETYSGRERKIKRNCSVCGKLIHKSTLSGLCFICFYSKRKNSAHPDH